MEEYLLAFLNLALDPAKRSASLSGCLAPEKEPSETGWITEPVWTLWRKEENLTSA
jgi:hypothetical protein